MAASTIIKTIWPDALALSHAVANLIVTESNKAVQQKGYFTIALSGGSTPKILFESKVPGVQMTLKPVEMDFTYKESYTEATPEAYETLLLDILDGDATLFMRSDQVEAAWKVVMPIINAWKKNPKKQLLKYTAGSWGPAAATSLLKPFAKKWVVLPAVKK